MVVYVEYVLLDNLIIDAMLISLSRKAIKLPTKKRGVFLASSIGSVSAALMPLLKLNIVCGLLIKVLIALLVVLFSGKFKSAREYFKCFCLFLIFTFTFGGAVTSVFWGLGLSFDPVNYSHGGEVPLFAILSIVFAVYKLCQRGLKAIYKRKSVINFTAQCAFQIGGKTFVRIAFLDSGNSLVYKKTDSPIAVCSDRLIRDLRNEGALDCAYVDCVKIKTVSGESVLPIYKADKFLIYNCQKPNIIDNVMLAEAGNVNLSDKEFDLIIGPLVYEVA